MDETQSAHGGGSIKSLIASFENAPLFSSLGTLSPTDTNAAQELMKMGRVAIPELVAALGSDKPQIVIYAAYVLGRIGDSSVLPQLREIQDAYSAKEPKGALDFSIVTAARRAIDTIGAAPR